MRFHIDGIIVMLFMSVLITIWLAPCTTNNNNPIKDIYTVKKTYRCCYYGVYIVACFNNACIVRTFISGRSYGGAYIYRSAYAYTIEEGGGFGKRKNH